MTIPHRRDEQCCHICFCERAWDVCRRPLHVTSSRLTKRPCWFPNPRDVCDGSERSRLLPPLSPSRYVTSFAWPSPQVASFWKLPCLTRSDFRLNRQRCGGRRQVGRTAPGSACIGDPVMLHETWPDRVCDAHDSLQRHGTECAVHELR